MDKIAIISTRLGGIDGVSIEAKKWADAFICLGLYPVYIAGNFMKANLDDCILIEEMDFNHPEILKIKEQAFKKYKAANSIAPQNEVKLRQSIDNIKNLIKNKLNHELKKLNLKYISIENALSIPLNIPLGIALTEIIAENKIQTITRHHDFYWERAEFLNSFIEDILINYFPPCLECLKHVVINSNAKESLFLRKKIRSFHIPNIFDFSILKNPRYYNLDIKKDLRNFLDIKQDD